MQENTTSIERAFQLAGMGRFGNVNDILRRLNAEGYNTDAITGPLLLGQLRKQINRATR